MLRIYSTSLDIVRTIRPVLESIEQRDGDLGRQMRRALTSVPLNFSEGSASRGRNRAARYHTAAGSMREVMAAIDVSVALGYIQPPAAVLTDSMGLVVNTLIKLALA